MHIIDTVSSARSELGSSRTGICFELHAAGLEPDEIVDAAHLPFYPAARRPSAAAISIWEDARLVWVETAEGSGSAPLEVIPSRKAGALGLQVVRRQFSAYLAMQSLRDDVLVNGLPAMRFSALSSQDSIVLGEPQQMFYVTERFFPWVGPPPEKSVSRERCAHCRHVLEAGTRVVSCYCGALVHWETAESHPHVNEGDRLDCAERRKMCPCCGRELTTQEYLVWDPATI
jgi:hypothetical protein